jgi:HAD superfamily hydrolase (TIGR01549 family)
MTSIPFDGGSSAKFAYLRKDMVIYMNNIMHFIWDFDGTLFDTYPLIVNCFRSALKDFGCDADEKDIMELMLNSIPHTVKYYSEKYKLSDSLAEHYIGYMKRETELTSPPFENAGEVLSKINELGCYNYIFTHRGDSTYDFLNKYKLTPYFREIVTANQGFPSKPAPDAVLYLVNKYGMKLDEAVMIGDREIDILSGKNAGIRTCHFVNTMVPQNVESDYRIYSLYDILDLLNDRIENKIIF